MTPDEFESRTKQLVGCRIRQVRYHEIDYKDADGQPLAVPAWNGSPDFDSLDFGLDLMMDNGVTFHVTWGTEFTQYGITVSTDPLYDADVVRIWDVSAASRWAPLVGQRITSADVFWSWYELTGGSQRTEYPQDIQLTFEDGSHVYLSAYEVQEGDFRWGMMDHVTVFFGDEAAEPYRIGPFASERHG